MLDFNIPDFERELAKLYEAGDLAAVEDYLKKTLRYVESTMTVSGCSSCECHDEKALENSDYRREEIEWVVTRSKGIIAVSEELGALYRDTGRPAEALDCFLRAKESSSVMHMPKGTEHDLLFHMKKIEKVDKGQGFANELYTEILFIEFMILLNRALMTNQLEKLHEATYDPKVQLVLEYINSHLEEDLTVDLLADTVFVSKYHLMRKFKAETGYSVHQYITSKRLLLAKELLNTTPASITDICFQCGFRDYSTFSREFKKQFKISARKYRQE